MRIPLVAKALFAAAAVLFLAAPALAIDDRPLFASRIDLDVGNGPRSVAIGDLDGDLDLVTANRSGGGAGGGTVSVLLGQGDGTFGSPTQYAVGSDPRSIALGDLEGDGVSDLAVTNRSSFDVSILLGAGDGTFTTEQRFGTGWSPSSIAIADLNGNGKCLHDRDRARRGGGCGENCRRNSRWCMQLVWPVWNSFADVWVGIRFVNRGG